MNANDEVLTKTPDQRQKASFKLLGRRRKDKAKLMLIINICAAVLMVLVRWAIG
jgi:hypothetical protein